MLNLIDINLDIIFHCFKGNNKTSKEILVKTGFENDIHVIPLETHDYVINNLFPKHDNVQLWSTLCVGTDLKYILCNINQDLVHNAHRVLNTDGKDVLDPKLHNFFNTVFETTLTGKQLQFYMIWNGVVMFCNSYVLRNQNNQIIGAMLFVRNFQSLMDTTPIIRSSFEERRHQSASS